MRHLTRSVPAKGQLRSHHPEPAIRTVVPTAAGGGLGRVRRRGLRYQALGFQQSPVGAALVDHRDVFVAVNKAFCALVGRASRELLGAACNLVIGDTVPMPGSDARRKRLTRPDGTTIVVQVRLSVVPGPGVRPCRMIRLYEANCRHPATAGTARNVHGLLAIIRAQRAVTAAVHSRDEVLQVMADQALQAFAAADGTAVELLAGDVLSYAAVAGSLSAHRGLKLHVANSLSGIAMAEQVVVHCEDTEIDERVNREACRSLGIRAMSIAPLLSGDEPIGVLKLASSEAYVLGGEDVHRLELLAASLTAALRHADDFAANVHLLTERTAALAARDRAAAQLAERNSELDAANKIKRDLIGMLGHEIRCPLSAIRAYADLLVAEWAGLSEETRYKDVQAIDRNAARLDLIVDEVLMAVTTDAKRLTAHPQNVDLEPNLRAIVESADVDPAIVGCTRGLAVLAEPHHIEQIVGNLLSNAAKYGGGAIRVTARRDVEMIRIEVSDAGPGVPDEFVPHLFGRYARAEATSGTVPGTGLGLFIVRELARINGGDVTYEPAGEGATFVVSLPPARRAGCD